MSVEARGSAWCTAWIFSVYRGALQPTESQPATTWMVGDNLEWDVAASMHLVLTGVWLDRVGHGLPSSAPLQPDPVIRSLAELL